MNSSTKSFCSSLFQKFLYDVESEQLKAIFKESLTSRQAKQHESVIEGIRTFLKYFFLKDRSLRSSSTYDVVKKKVELVEEFLYYDIGNALL